MSSTKHSCKCLLVHCIDFRFQNNVDALIRSLGIDYGTFDRASVAGGAGNFEALEYHTSLSKKLHGPDLAILTIHEDCGAGAKKEDLKRAGKIAALYFSRVRCFYLKLDDTFDEV